MGIEQCDCSGCDSLTLEKNECVATQESICCPLAGTYCNDCLKKKQCALFINKQLTSSQ